MIVGIEVGWGVGISSSTEDVTKVLVGIEVCLEWITKLGFLMSVSAWILFLGLFLWESFFHLEFEG